MRCNRKYILGGNIEIVCIGASVIESRMGTGNTVQGSGTGILDSVINWFICIKDEWSTMQWLCLYLA